MIQHIVLIKSKQDSVDELARALRDFCSLAPVHIPGVISASSGANFCAASPEFDQGLVVTMRDKAALDGYTVHPEHKKVGAILRQLMDGRPIVVDFDC